MKKYKCIVPVSGGKDSQACLKMAVEEFGADEVMGLFCDTKFEHPKTYAHVESMKELYGVDIHTISGGSVEEKVRKYKRFPGGGARHCTDELKIRETKIFLKEYSEEHGTVEVWYGMRIDESSERSKRYAYKDPDELYQPHEILAKYPKYLGANGVRYRLPIVDWYTHEVMEYLEGEHNPLYDEGFERVGCFPCLAGGDAWKIKAFTHDDFGAEQLIRVKNLEVSINEILVLEHEEKRKSLLQRRKEVIVRHRLKYDNKKKALDRFDKLNEKYFKPFNPMRIFSTKIGKAFEAGCMSESDQVDMFGDSSQGCRICEI